MYIFFLCRIPDELRPVKLKKIVIGYDCDKNKSYFRFDMNLNYQLVDIINRFANGKPTLIFCSTRKGVELAANVLLKDLSIELRDDQLNSIIKISSQIQDMKLKNALLKGIAYHHAGLSINDRLAIENAFRKSQLAVLLCTSTLAMGINLPAHLVIIKSTQSYQQVSCEELPESTILQMIGRAGRPQFDTSGIAVVMTQKEKQVFITYIF